MWERLPRRDSLTSNRPLPGRDVEVAPTFGPFRSFLSTKLCYSRGGKRGSYESIAYPLRGGSVRSLLRFRVNRSSSWFQFPTHACRTIARASGCSCATDQSEAGAPTAGSTTADSQVSDETHFAQLQ